MQYAIKQATLSNYPNEMCGIVTKQDIFIEIDNVSESPTDSFILSPFKFYELRDNIKYIVHSHTKQRHLHICTPSVKDMENQKIWKYPFLIAGYDGIVYTEPFMFPAERSQHYLDRPYIYGIYDCGTLAMDFYHFELGITLDIDPLLSLTPKKDWDKSIQQLLQSNNFKEVKSPKFGDLITVNVFGGFNNHVIIYINEHTVLNQNKYSVFEPIEDKLHSFSKIYRHESLC